MKDIGNSIERRLGKQNPVEPNPGVQNLVHDKSEEKNKLTDEQIIYRIILKSLSEGKSFALWRMPGNNQKNLCISNGPLIALDELTIEELDPGFIFSPFDPGKKKYFLAAEKIYHFSGKQNEISNQLIPEFDLTKESNELDKKLLPLHFQKKKDFPKRDFEGFATKCIQAIEEGQAEKIVPSSFQDQPLPENFNALEVFNNFCAKYPNAFVSLTSSPEVGTWLGASPELLVTVDKNGKFKTVALAGTQPYQEGMNLKLVAWTQKDIEEQAMVSRYIINCLKKVRVREYIEHGPRTVIAGTLLHLKTDYEVDTKEINFPQMGSVMLKLLHPTSAVCGMPHAPAFEFLKGNEGYDREMYAGFFGPVNVQNETNLFVNLRCMQLFSDVVRVYAGAGVIADSIAQKEKEEVEMKLQSILKNINS
jgi:isochorismate synthase